MNPSPIVQNTALYTPQLSFETLNNPVLKDIISGHILCRLVGDETITFMSVSKAWNSAMLEFQKTRLRSLHSLITFVATSLKEKMPGETNLLSGIQIELDRIVNPPEIEEETTCIDTLQKKELETCIDTLPKIELEFISIMERVSLFILEFSEEEIKAFQYDLEKKLNPFVKTLFEFINIYRIKKLQADTCKPEYMGGILRIQKKDPPFYQLFEYLEDSNVIGYYKWRILEKYKIYIDQESPYTTMLRGYFINVILQLANESYYNYSLRLLYLFKEIQVDNGYISKKYNEIYTDIESHIIGCLLKSRQEERAFELIKNMSEPYKTVTFLYHVPFEMKKWLGFFGNSCSMASSILDLQPVFFFKNPEIAYKIAEILDEENLQMLAFEVRAKAKVAPSDQPFYINSKDYSYNKIHFKYLPKRLFEMDRMTAIYVEC